MPIRRQCVRAAVVDLIVACATQDPALDLIGITAFLVKRDTQGVIVDNLWGKTGVQTSRRAEVAFDNCAFVQRRTAGRAKA